jgi:hypothetical protein
VGTRSGAGFDQSRSAAALPGDRSAGRAPSAIVCTASIAPTAA